MHWWITLSLMCLFNMAQQPDWAVWLLTGWYASVHWLSKGAIRGEASLYRGRW